MQVIVAGALEDGRSAVVSRETVEHGQTSTLWKSSEAPPRVDRPGRHSLDIGIGPGHAAWMVVHKKPDTVDESHQTDVVSFTTVVAGSIVLTLDAENIRLEAGDHLALLGVMHGWETGPDGATLVTTAIGLDADS